MKIISQTYQDGDWWHKTYQAQMPLDSKSKWYSERVGLFYFDTAGSKDYKGEVINPDNQKKLEIFTVKEKDEGLSKMIDLLRKHFPQAELSLGESYFDKEDTG